MPYVERNQDGTIKGIYATRQPGIAEEFVSDAEAVIPAPLNIDALNAALATKGSLSRGLAMLMFKEINKLRVKDGDPAYTLAQFKAALDAEMG